ncbi:DUF4270 domain-containing protein [Pontibacter vulgaris]|uniref:DUF4270 domain-containing protein n=1 Tax=Pontibacter vulgaris TaxID=2905679 RepID=UPI001FA6B70A|nr:DUF4270 domain-containing protein [Pontibacter vulgaris]
MNLAVRRFLLFFFSIAALTACEDAKDIGIELQDENQIGTDYTDTLTINTGTVLLNDSILSFKASPALVGKYNDPVLGSVSANNFTELGLGTSNLKFGDNPVADSLVLTLDYNLIYGNKTAPLTLNVYQLTEGFQEKATYFTNSNLAYESSPIGSKTFVPQLIKIKKNNVEVDSAVLVKIKFDQAFLQKIVAESDKDPLKTQANFNNFLKGIALVAADNAGSIVGFNMTSANTSFILYYKNGTEQKKHSFTFNRDIVRSFNRVTGNRTGTSVESLQNKGDFKAASETGGESYIQTNTQLLTKLTIPYLKEFKEAKGNIIINRAELIVPIKKSSASTLTAPPQLVMYETNSKNEIIRNAAGTPTSVQLSRSSGLNGTAYPAVLTIPASKEYYTVNVTPYIQAILLGNKQNNGILLAPANVVATGNLGQSQIQTESRPYRAIISNTGTDKAKLLLYYSKLN